MRGRRGRPLDRPAGWVGSLGPEQTQQRPDRSLRASELPGDDVLPDSRLVVLEGLGQVSSVEAPDAVTAELRRFLHSVW